MRLSSALVPLALLCAAAATLAQSHVTPAPVPTCADLHLVPAPRECSAVQAVIFGNRADKQFGVSDRDPWDEIAAVEREIDAINQVSSGMSFSIELEPRRGSKNAVSVRFMLTKILDARNLLARHQTTFDRAMHDEGYVMFPGSEEEFVVIAETSAGLFYGAQTVKQLIRNSGDEPVLLMPTIRDWPAMPHRGLSDDWSRGPIPSMDFLKREIRTLAAYKYNIFSPYFEHTFAYASTPVVAFPGGAMTPAEARELVAYAAQYHIVIIPEQESFGHLHHVLKFEQYSSLGETPHGSVLAPGDPATLPLIGGWFTELAKVFPGPYAHIGADETFELGLGRTRDQVKQQGLGKVYLDFLSRIHAQLEPNHKQLLFWGDIAVNSPDLVGTLPKDMIAVPWEYDAKPDFTSLILPFSKAGLETWVAPGVNNWNRIYPNNNEALGNIRAFVRDGQKLGSKGMLNTVWNDDGEGIFDENWFGVLFGAAASWQPGESSEDNFVASFGQAFHRDQTGKISQAQREIMAAHALLRKAGLNDAEDSLFWADPFSAEGQRVAEKIRPALAELRLHAERAITLVAEARAATRLDNQEALDALELGARRIDFVGLKFQTADESLAIYNQAREISTDKARWGEVEERLWTTGERFQDLRDGYALLGGLYRQAWMRDNRPYWFENNQARYDQATQLWIARGQRWSQVLDGWWNTHTLPEASEAGLPAMK